MRKSEWFLVIMIVVFFATGAWFYPQLPAQVVAHWNASGEANGGLPRGWGAFLLPLIFAIIAAIFFAIPRIDPRRENFAKFRRYYDWFVAVLAIVFYYIYLLTLLLNVGYSFDLSVAIIPPMAGLFYVAGMLVPRTEPNWFVGVRTPWTLSSPAVWRKTNQAGGWALRAAGVVALAGIFFPQQIGLWFLIAPILIAAIGLVVYSYVLYERERK